MSGRAGGSALGVSVSAGAGLGGDAALLGVVEDAMVVDPTLPGACSVPRQPVPSTSAMATGTSRRGLFNVANAAPTHCKISERVFVRLDEVTRIASAFDALLKLMDGHDERIVCLAVRRDRLRRDDAHTICVDWICTIWTSALLLRPNLPAER